MSNYLMSDDTLTDAEVLQEEYGKTELGKLIQTFDRIGVFYSVHNNELGKAVYIQTNLGPHTMEVCEMQFDKNSVFMHAKGMGV